MVDAVAATSPPARIDALDGVRGLAILLVVVMHALFFGVPLPGVPPLSQESVYVRLAGLGWCGVDVFFVLSGFLITGILWRSRGAPHYFRNFYARRALRIFPLYYLVLALLLWGLGRAPTTPAEQWSYLLYYQNLRFGFGGDAVADPARDITWSLAIEEQFYLLWPAVVAVASRRGLLRCCVVLIVASIALRFAGPALGIPKPYFLTFCRLDGLAAGALLALSPLPPRWFGWSALVAGVTALVAIAFATGNALPHAPEMQTFGLLAALALAVGVLVAARHPGIVQRVVSLAPLRWLGQYSYCIYLVHFLVIEALAFRCYGPLGVTPDPVRQWLAANVPPTLLLVAFTGICLVASSGVAWLSWHLFERWFLALKRFVPSHAA